MQLISIVDEDWVNYKKPSMFLIFPKCSMKCGKKCQNRHLLQEEPIEVNIDSLIDRYMNNDITKAVVCGGLEPFDSWQDLQAFIMNFRYYSPDDIVIYTGYTEEELKDKLPWLSVYENIYVKVGRYMPKCKSYKSDLLGIELASTNQYVITYNNFDLDVDYFVENPPVKKEAAPHGVED